MAAGAPAKLRRRISRAAFIPADLLVLLVPLLMTTVDYGRHGLYAIFWSFGGGIVIAVLAPLLSWFQLISTRTTTSVFALGGTLTLAAVLLYLVFGCVFGCPG